MCATEQEKQIYGSGVEVLMRTERQCTYRITGTDGDAVITRYTVFPGMELLYNNIHTGDYFINHAARGNVIEIDHCREGRMECLSGDSFFYLAPGDFAVRCKEKAGHEARFPFEHYHGITVLIDLAQTPACLSCLLEDVNVCPSALAEKFCGKKSCFVARSKACIEHVFSELYAVADSVRYGYYKVKLLELVLFLSAMQADEGEAAGRALSRAQVALAKAVCGYLREHIDRRVTIAELADVFCVSQTALKSSFKGVYGVPVYAFLRAQKMQIAASLLSGTGQSVIEIAGRCGYDNASKFAGAFRAVTGISPAAYRNTASRGCERCEPGAVRCCAVMGASNDSPDIWAAPSQK